MYFLIFVLLFPSFKFPIQKTNNPEPKKAALYSFVYPGLGEYYTGNTKKAVVISSVATFFVGKALYHYYQYKTYHDEYLKSGVYSYKLEYENQFSSFMSALFYYIGIWGFSMVDSYISAHLSKFYKVDNKIDMEFNR